MLTSSGLLETLPSTPERAIIKPITVPINPNITKIVDESGLSRSTVYKILRKLEENNLIEAFQSESDKRESIVSLKV